MWRLGVENNWAGHIPDGNDLNQNISRQNDRQTEN